MSVPLSRSGRLPVFADITAPGEYQTWLAATPRTLREVFAFWKSQCYATVLESEVLAHLPEGFRKAEVLDHLSVLTEHEWAQIDLILQGRVSLDCVQILDQSLPGKEVLRIWGLDEGFLLNLRLEQALNCGLDTSCHALLRLVRAGLLKEFFQAYSQLSTPIKKSLGCVDDFVIDCLRLHLPQAFLNASNMDDVRTLLHLAGDWQLETEPYLAKSKEVVSKLLATSELCEADRNIPQLFCPTLKLELAAYVYRGIFSAFIRMNLDEREEFFRWALPRLRNPGSPQVALTPDELLAKVARFLKKSAADLAAVFQQSDAPWIKALEAAGGMDLVLATALESSLSKIHPQHAKEAACLLAPSWIAKGQQKALLDYWDSVEWSEAMQDALLQRPDMLPVKLKLFTSIPDSIHAEKPELLWQLLKAGSRESELAFAKIFSKSITLELTPDVVIRLLKALQRPPTHPEEVAFFEEAFEACTHFQLSAKDIAKLLSSAKDFSRGMRAKIRFLHVYLHMQRQQKKSVSIPEIRGLLTLALGRFEIKDYTVRALTTLVALLKDKELPLLWRLHLCAVWGNWLNQVEVKGCERIDLSAALGVFAGFVHANLCSTNGRKGWLAVLPAKEAYSLSSICFSVFARLYDRLFDEQARRSSYINSVELATSAMATLRLMDHFLQVICRPPQTEGMQAMPEEFLRKISSVNFASFGGLLNRVGQTFVNHLNKGDYSFMAGAQFYPLLLDLMEKSLVYYVGTPASFSSWPSLTDAAVCPTTEHLDTWATALLVLQSEKCKHRNEQRMAGLWDSSALKLCASIQHVVALAKEKKRFIDDPLLWKGLSAVLSKLVYATESRPAASQTRIMSELVETRAQLVELASFSLAYQSEDKWLKELHIDSDTQMVSLITNDNARLLRATDSCLACVGLDAIAHLLLISKDRYLKPYPEEYKELGLHFCRAAQGHVLQISFMIDKKGDYLAPFLVPGMLKLMHALSVNAELIRASDDFVVDRAYFEQLVHLWKWFTIRPEHGGPAGWVILHIYDLDLANPQLNIDSWGAPDWLADYSDAKPALKDFREKTKI